MKHVLFPLYVLLSSRCTLRNGRSSLARYVRYIYKRTVGQLKLSVFINSEKRSTGEITALPGYG
jgi:hypothetical protein